MFQGYTNVHLKLGHTLISILIVMMALLTSIPVDDMPMAEGNTSFGTFSIGSRIIKGSLRAVEVEVDTKTVVIAPDETKVVNITIFNDIEFNETYFIDAIWNTTYLNVICPAKIYIKGRTTDVVPVSISAAEKVYMNVTDYVSIRIRGENTSYDQNISVSVGITVYRSIHVKFKQDVLYIARDAFPGEKIRYYINISNTGNTLETLIFQYNITSNTEIACYINPSIVMVDAYGFAYATITCEIPLETSIGESISIYISWTSEDMEYNGTLAMDFTVVTDSRMVMTVSKDSNISMELGETRAIKIMVSTTVSNMCLLTPEITVIGLNGTTLSDMGIYGWDIKIIPTNLTITSNSTESFFIEITAPGKAFIGAHGLPLECFTLIVKATWNIIAQDSGTFMTNHLIYNISLDLSAEPLIVSPVLTPFVIDAEPGETIKFCFNMTNPHSYSVFFSIALQTNLTGTWYLLSGNVSFASGEISGGMHLPVTLVFSIDSGAHAGHYNLSMIINTTYKTYYINGTIKIKSIYGFDIDMATDVVYVGPMGHGNGSFIITNTGNGYDIFVFMPSAQYTDTLNFKPSSIALESNQWAQINITIDLSRYNLTFQDIILTFYIRSKGSGFQIRRELKIRYILPDLAVRSVEMIDPQRGKGQIIVENMGNATSIATILKIIDTNGNEYLYNLSSISPGDTDTIPFIVDVHKGKNTIYVEIDPKDKVMEWNQGNNIYIINFTVNGQKATDNIQIPYFFIEYRVEIVGILLGLAITALYVLVFVIPFRREMKRL